MPNFLPLEKKYRVSIATSKLFPKINAKSSLALRPEILQATPSGMEADIFSLGAMYVEMIGLCDNKRLSSIKNLRPEGDHSFRANISHSQSWLDALSSTTRQTDIALLTLISEMLSPSPQNRPTAMSINDRLSIYTPDLAIHQREGTYSLRYYSPCCRHIYLSPKEEFYTSTQWTRHLAPPKASWLIRTPDKKAFDTLFNKIDTYRLGLISKAQVLDFADIWRVPAATLLQIWKLAAIRDGEYLGKEEFAVAMFLIRTQCGSVNSLPTKLPQKLVPPSLREELFMKDDAPRGYLYNCPKADCPFQAEKGLTTPERLKQHLKIFHLEIVGRRRGDSFRGLPRPMKEGQKEGKEEGKKKDIGLGVEQPVRTGRLEDSRAKMAGMGTEGENAQSRLSLMEQATRKRGVTICGMGRC
jgi:hypothetical protein